MATIETQYVGDGSTVLYSITFPYIEESDVLATLDGASTTQFSIVNATTVEFVTAPAVGVAIRLYRSTSVDAPKATFFPGSAIRGQDLNNNFEQTLFVVQEATFNTDQAAIDSAVARATALAAEAKADTAVADSAAAQTAATQAQTDAATAAADAAQASADASSASADAVAAQTSAAAANKAVQDAALFVPIPNVAAIPVSPADQDRVSVLDSTGIESVPNIGGLPSGPVYDSGSYVNIVYQQTSTSWEFVSYGVNDPDDRYIRDNSGTVATTNLADGAVTAAKAAPGILLPTGAVTAFAGSTAPVGYLECNGQSTSGFPELAAVVGATVPDLRGEFIRGWSNGSGVDSGRAILSSQADEFKSHNHTNVTAGSHQHTIGSAGSHQHGINNAGSHSHEYYAYGGSGSSPRPSIRSDGGGATAFGTNTAGLHKHTMDTAGVHNHSMGTEGAHTHVINASGGAETRPRNIALMYIIKT